MRVFELAQTLKTTSADVLRQAAALKLDAHSPLSRLDDDDIRELKAHFTRRSATDLGREAQAREAALQAKQARAVQQRQEHAAAELKALSAAVQRAREAEARLGKAGATVEAPAVAIAPAAPMDAAVTAAPAPEAEPAPAATAETAPAAGAPVAESAEGEEAPAPAAHRPKRFEPAEVDQEEELAAPFLNRLGRDTATPAKMHAAKPKEQRDRTDRPERSGAARVEMPARPAPAPAPGRGAPAPVRGAASAAPRPGMPARPPLRGVTPAAPGRTQTAAPAAQRPRFAPPAPAAAAPAAPERVLTLRGPTLVKDLAEMMGVRPNRLIADLMQLNVLASINQRVDLEMAGRIAEKYGYRVELERVRRSGERKPVLKRLDADDAIPDDRPEDMMPRPPVVTFLGHVDHGKTSLMDRIRKTSVVTGEAGGITQHIGAYTVEINGRKITFLDTPGHAAFSAMRARGASLTDIAVIIIAADDGIMPQTREVIKQARQANVQILVALNKCDLPTARPDRVRQQLQGEGLTPEEWGGDIVSCEVSAATGKGIDHLLEMILLQADVLELQANPNRRAEGYVIEAQLEQGRGPTATLLVSAGTLKVGDVVLIGEHFGRLRGLMDDRGRMVKSAGPATAVRVMGLSGVPEAGAEFRVMLNEKRARELAEKFTQERKETELAGTAKVVSLDALMSKISAQNKLEMSLIIKADTQGSVEAIVDSLREIKSEKIGLNIIHSGIGNVTSNDIQRAGAGQAVIVGFQVGVDAGVQAMARHEGVRTHTFRIIYELFDYVKQAMLDMLAPEYREVIRGHAQIRAIFSIGKKGKVAGCQMLDGVLRADARVRIKRLKDVIFDGRMSTLQHFQDEVTEVREAQECGIRFENFEGFAEGDIVECYVKEELERTL